MLSFNIKKHVTAVIHVVILTNDGFVLQGNVEYYTIMSRGMEKF